MFWLSFTGEATSSAQDPVDLDLGAGVDELELGFGAALMRSAKEPEDFVLVSGSDMFCDGK